MSALRVKNLSKIFSENNLKIFDQINFSIEKGQIITLIGPSGCGKSTLLNILSGIDQPTNGQIFINNKLTVDRRGLSGYMAQDPNLLPWKTALENIALGLEIKKSPKTIARKRAKEMLKKFNLGEFADFHPRKLSGGMKQRIALMRTVLFNNNILLLDEPFGALDQISRIDCQEFLLEMRQKLNPTILLVTHDHREAILLSDWIIVLSKSPATIIESIKIDLPRSGYSKILYSKKAIKLEQKIHSLLTRNKNE